MMKSNNSSSNSGLALVEVLIATAIVLAFLLALFTVNNLYLKTAFSNTGSVKATFLAEESLEVMRFLRDLSWDNISVLTPGANYHLTFESNLWQTTVVNVFIDNLFERVVTLSEVYRDASGDIVSNGGTLDPDTRLITATVSWKVGSATTTRSVSTYLSKIRDE